MEKGTGQSRQKGGGKSGCFAKSNDPEMVDLRRLRLALPGCLFYTRPLMPQMEKKTMSIPDERRAFDRGQVELVTLGGVTFGRATLQPGWRWSTCVKPIVNTKSCEASHLQYHLSGRLRVRMDDGSEEEFGPGEVSLLPPGHDAWVVGDEPVVVVDISGMTNYASSGAS